MSSTSRAAKSKNMSTKMVKTTDFSSQTNEEDGYRLISNGTKPPDITSSAKENSWMAGVQMFVSFLLAGFGMVAASLLLDQVQHWEVYRNISEVYVLVPALLGLKGNLEMTLASRLSTHAHLGHLDTSLGSLVVGNLCLVQCQAVLVGFLAAMAAVAMGWIPDGDFNIHHALLLCASSVLTASFASFVLGLIMIGVIVGSKKFYINPDNIATPIAASLGDLTTLALLSWIASVLYKSIGTSVILPSIIIIIGAGLVPVCGYMAWKNKFTQQALDEGWIPVVSAMVISSVGGLILDFTVSNYKGIAVYQLVINGIGGNMAAVHASRLSTLLHTGRTEDSVISSTTKLLLVMVIPGQLIFIHTIGFLKAGHTSLTPIFIFVYMFAAILQVFLLLTISHYMVILMWKLGMDPDNSAIPYLTALGDLLGTALLGVAFHVLYAIGDKDSDLGD